MGKEGRGGKGERVREDKGRTERGEERSRSWVRKGERERTR